MIDVDPPRRRASDAVPVERTEPEVRLARQKTQLHFLAWAVGVLVSVGVVASLMLIIAQTGRLAEIAETNRANGERLIDCTTPGGTCYEEGQSRTGEAIATINEVTILAAACAKAPGNDTEAEIRACIEQGLGN